MAAIADLRVYPVKALDGVSLEESEITPGGALVFDREFALFDADGEVVNGKRTPRVHEISADFDPATGELTVDRPDGPAATFDPAAERERPEEWFGAAFDREVRLARDATTGFPDRPSMGPSVISTATLREVASWFDGLTVEGARRRLRANVEVSGVPAFWEDRFVGDGAPAFEAGGVRVEGVTPCGRCVVPERDPDTGEPLEGFRETFVERREATFPEWGDREAFDHLYSLMLIARIPEEGRGERLAVGDDVEVVSG